MYLYIEPQHLCLHLNFSKWHNNVPLYFIYILIFLWSLLILLLWSFLGVSLLLLFVLLLLLRLETGKVVMVATDMYRISPYGSAYTELRESMTFLPFSFSFLIINFHNFGYIFALHHYSAICWDFILRLICFDTCIIFLFYFLCCYTFHWRQWPIWNCCNVWKGAFYDYYLRIPVIVLCNRGICLGCVSSPRSTSSYIFFQCK